MNDKDETELNKCELYRDLMRLGALVQTLRNEMSELKTDIFTLAELDSLIQKFDTIKHFSMVGTPLVRKIYHAAVKKEEEEEEERTEDYCRRDDDEDEE